VRQRSQNICNLSVIQFRYIERKHHTHAVVATSGDYETVECFQVDSTDDWRI
jgi:hypothetical protein